MQAKVGWIHPTITAVVQILIGILFGNWWLGGLLSVVWFCSREQTQAEYRAIQLIGGRRSELKWYNVYDPKIWTVHSITDFITPTVVAIIIFVVSTIL